MAADTERERFYHPYKPYDIQLDFMRALYDVFTNNYKIGLFESPTGTGKTLSLICSSMTWLREHKKNSFSQGFDEEEEEQSDDEPAWVKESYKSMVNKTKNDAAGDYERHLEEVAAKSENRRINSLKERKLKKIKKIEIESAEPDDAFVPADYVSEDEDRPEARTLRDKNEELGLEIKQLMRKLNGDDNKDSDLLIQNTKIFFASRTHSQLNQFSSQLRLPLLPSSYTEVEEHLKYLPLGSRKQLCIHKKVSNINDVTLMNEACLDHQRADSKDRCEFYPAPKNPDMQDKATEFKDSVFAKIRDIEDLPSLGEAIGVCPYYSVRKGVPYSEVMTLPYQLLLTKKSRDALGISIKDSIVVIDEAHNLLDTITSIHSVTVSVNEFELCKSSLKAYLQKFTRRMNGGNRVNLMKLIKIIDIILKYVSKIDKIAPGRPIDIMDMFQGTTGDLLNIHKLDKYLTVSKIAYKIESYMDKLDRHKTPVLFKIIEFLKSISNPSKEGKFFFDVKGPNVSLSYMLLDPSEVFRDIVDEAKCVILAGGTMEPTEDYYNYLFPYVRKEQVRKFTCGHVIPKENLEVFVMGKRTVDFEFSFDKRDNLNMIKDVGEAVYEVIENVPGGAVVFFPSYKYLADVLEGWKKTGVYEKINCKKKVFSESSTTDVLADYSTEIAKGGGGLLLSVIGGRLSEGINFSDDLARAVMVIGLPYPNAFSGEIISKRKFIEDQVLERTGGDKAAANEATRDFYENICMRAVNQSVGRSIRHRNDYATIYLFDKRYSGERIENKLSEWIKLRISKGLDHSGVVARTKSFFQQKGRTTD